MASLVEELSKLNKEVSELKAEVLYLNESISALADETEKRKEE